MQLIALDSFFILINFSSELLLSLISSSINTLFFVFNLKEELFFNNKGSLFAFILLRE